MLQATENVLNEFEEIPSSYGTFKDRVFALLIDGLVLLPVSIIIWLDKTTWKSQLVLIIVALIEVLYKPFCEYKYGATIGKRAMKLIVVDKSFLKAGLKEVVIRNIFNIVWGIFFSGITLLIFRNAAFASVSSNAEFTLLQNKVFNINPYLVVYCMLIIAEIIFILSDNSRRALHDRLGGTFVVKHADLN